MLDRFRASIVLGTLLFGLLLPIPAEAGLINFDSLTRGSILTNQLQAQGIVVSGIQGSGIGLVPGEVLDVSLGDRGVFDFGGSLPQAILYGIVGDQLNINFVLPDGTPGITDLVSLRVGDGDSASESFRVSFLRIDGTLLNAQELTTTGGLVNGGATVSFAGAGINRVEVLGIGSGSGGAVDDLNFNPVQAVPEPSSLVSAALGLAGLAGYAGWRRRHPSTRVEPSGR